jgi:hypothetical protein
MLTITDERGHVVARNVGVNEWEFFDDSVRAMYEEMAEYGLARFDLAPLPVEGVLGDAAVRVKPGGRLFDEMVIQNLRGEGFEIAGQEATYG